MAETRSLTAADGRRQMLLLGGGALLLALVITAVWYLFIHTPYVAAFTQLKTDDAALIVDELKKQKTPYELAESGSTILVPQDQVDAVRLAILGGGLPLKGTVGFELFNKSDMGLTEFAQKINYQRALQGELARTLMTLDNVESARVHVTLPEDGVFRDDRRPAKASVTLMPKLGTSIDGQTIVGIQRLVASAVEGLDAINVVVLDDAGRQLSGEARIELPGLPEGAGRSPLEQGWANRVRQAVAGQVQDPRMQIHVIVPAGAEQLAAAPSPAPGATPGAKPAAAPRRAYPVAITMLLSREPEAGLKARLYPLLQAQLGIGDHPADSFDLLGQPGSSPFEVAQPVATASGRARPVANADTGQGLDFAFGGAIAIGLGLAALALALVLLVRRRKPQLDAAGREAFAARLRDLLDERAGHGQA
ncbi:flagellar basal-body MS-ring/collar protein FliF [Novosphingobium sp. B 225]|uniref:flagellar basal-body MS-ring/collar protein FliF n=1 Tax=Novosphingobium sp. B 225 TaxID=1961849 RepID=UPI000B4A97FC|nr:flagellar basal-body MS-ring/collar protein FliF [Novosphingobium sp. B 225]